MVIGGRKWKCIGEESGTELLMCVVLGKHHPPQLSLTSHYLTSLLRRPPISLLDTAARFLINHAFLRSTSIGVAYYIIKIRK